MARKFYYDADGEKLGPVTGHELLRLRAEGVISSSTWVRAENSQTWRPLANVDLREEQASARSGHGVLRQLLGGLSPMVWLILILVLVSLVTMFIFVLKFMWPLLMFGLIAYLTLKVLRAKW